MQQYKQQLGNEMLSQGSPASRRLSMPKLLSAGMEDLSSFNYLGTPSGSSENLLTGLPPRGVNGTDTSAMGISPEKVAELNDVSFGSPKFEGFEQYLGGDFVCDSAEFDMSALGDTALSSNLGLNCENWGGEIKLA